jgi:hypothetical protein
MNIGSYSIPDVRLQPTLVTDLRTMYGKFEQRDVDFTTLASVWGHTNARSGTFTAKKAVMITYGLIEGRGKVHVTETGRKIAQIPPNPKELQEGLVEAISNIPLWKELYQKYTKVGKDLPTSDFWLDLRQMCQVSPEEAQNKAEMVRKAYLEDITGITSKGGDTGKMGDNQQSGGQASQGAVSSAGVETFKIGAIEIKLPKEGLKEAWEKAKKIIDIYIGNE